MTVITGPSTPVSPRGCQIVSRLTVSSLPLSLLFVRVDGKGTPKLEESTIKGICALGLKMKKSEYCNNLRDNIRERYKSTEGG